MWRLPENVQSIQSVLNCSFTITVTKESCLDKAVYLKGAVKAKNRFMEMQFHTVFEEVC